MKSFFYIFVIIFLPTASSNECLDKILYKMAFPHFNKDYEKALSILRENFQKIRSSKNPYIEEINKAYHNYIGDAPKINYEKNLERLLEDLSDDEISYVREILENRYHFNKVDKYSEGKTFAGYLNFQEEYINIILPEKFRGTDIEYFIKMHETIHVINNALIKFRGKVKSKIFLQSLLLHPKLSYYDEASAMAQEWHYISSIPEDTRKDIVKEILKTSEFSDSTKRFLTLSFLDSSKTPSGTVRRSQKELNRYNREDIKEAVRDNVSDRLTKAWFYGIFSLVSVSSICFSDTVKKELMPNYYEYICQKNPFFISLKKSFETF